MLRPAQIGFIFAVITAFSSCAARAEFRLAINGPAIPVFTWKVEHCGPEDMPDSPARALRLPNGDIYLTASMFSNIPFLGKTFETLMHICHLKSRGSENANPEVFNDRIWIQALTLGGLDKVYSLAVNEFAGRRHGTCHAPGSACWYSSITLWEASEPSVREFSPLPLPERVVVASPYKYSGLLTSRSGFFSTSNLVFSNGYLYALVYSEGISGQPAGVCVLRTLSPLNPKNGWELLIGGQYRRWILGKSPQQLSGRVCDVVSRDMIRSLVWVKETESWLGVSARGAEDKSDRCVSGGVFQLQTKDLTKWSRAMLLLPMVPFVVQKEAGIYFQYPSLIDEEDQSPEFNSASVKSGSIYLYLVRYNLWPDRRDGGNRDLIKFPVRFTD